MRPHSKTRSAMSLSRFANWLQQLRHIASTARFAHSSLSIYSPSVLHE